MISDHCISNVDTIKVVCSTFLQFKLSLKRFQKTLKNRVKLEFNKKKEILYFRETYFSVTGFQKNYFNKNKQIKKDS